MAPRISWALTICLCLINVPHNVDSFAPALHRNKHQTTRTPSNVVFVGQKSPRSFSNRQYPSHKHPLQIRMQMPPNVEDTSKTKAPAAVMYFNKPIFDRGNLGIAVGLVRNQAILGASALYTIASLQMDGSTISPTYTFDLLSLAGGLAGALPLCLVGFLISRSPSPALLDINVGTSMLALKLFGGRRALPWVTGLSSGLAMLTGVCEELSFRGLSLPILAQRLADSGAPPNMAAGYAASSIIFGLAHWSLGGGFRDNLVTVGLQTCSGAWFGALYLLSGSNLLVPAVAHAAYDAFTLIEAHLTSTGQLLYAREQISAAGGAGNAETTRLRAMATAAGAEEPDKLVDNSRVIFYLADTTRDGRLCLSEVRAAVRQLDLLPSEDLLRTLFRRAAAGESPAAAAGGEGEEDGGELGLEGWMRFVLLLKKQPSGALRPAPEKRGFLGLR